MLEVMDSSYHPTVKILIGNVSNGKGGYFFYMVVTNFDLILIDVTYFHYVQNKQKNST